MVKIGLTEERAEEIVFSVMKADGCPEGYHLAPVQNFAPDGVVPLDAVQEECVPNCDPPCSSCEFCIQGDDSPITGDPTWSCKTCDEQFGANHFCCPSGNKNASDSNPVLDKDLCVNCGTVDGYDVFEIVDGVCLCNACDCNEVYSALSEKCQTFCCSQPNPPQGCPKCPGVDPCVPPKVFDDDCVCVCPAIPACTGGRTKNDNCECVCPEGKIWVQQCSSCEDPCPFVEAPGLPSWRALVNGKCVCVPDCTELDPPMEACNPANCNCVEGTCIQNCANESKRASDCSCCPERVWDNNGTKVCKPNCLATQIINPNTGECEDCGEKQILCKNNSANQSNWTCMNMPECTAQQRFDQNACQCVLACPNPCTYWSSLANACLLVPCGDDLQMPVVIDGLCQCACRTTGLVPAEGESCPSSGPGGGFPKGGGGGGSGGGSGGSSTSSSCGTNAYGITTTTVVDGKEVQQELCYCNYGYWSTSNDGNCTDCAPGFVQDGKGGCVDPYFGTGDGTVNFIEKAKKTSLCDDVICPPGQCCGETVFGFYCSTC